MDFLQDFYTHKKTGFRLPSEPDLNFQNKAIDKP